MAGLARAQSRLAHCVDALVCAIERADHPVRVCLREEGVNRSERMPEVGDVQQRAVERGERVAGASLVRS